MRLTTKGRYAVTAMLDLALHFDQGAITLAEIAKRQGISLSYLEQLFAKLRRNGLVDSIRGPGGGYNLARVPHEITVASIISAINENVDVRKCKGQANCDGEFTCLTHQLWEDLSSRINDFLKGISLGDLVTEPKVQEAAKRQSQQEALAANSA